MDQVNTGKEWVAQLENGFREIIQTIKQVSDALSEISLATQESSRGIEQIGQGVEELSDVTEHNATLVDELASATEQLNEKAALLQHMTERFELGDAGNVEIEELSFSNNARLSPAERRGTVPPTTRPLREDLIVQQPMEEKSEDSIDQELDEGFEEF
jgi:uncharacterized phage infection (PIP) family protein YhgE